MKMNENENDRNMLGKQGAKRVFDQYCRLIDWRQNITHETW